MRVLCLALLLSVLVSCGGREPEPASQPAAPGEPQAQAEPTAATAYVVEDWPGGVVAGRVVLAGKVPPPGVILIDKDQEVCGTRRRVYPVQVSEGGVSNVVVWISDIKRGKAFAFPEPLLDQKECAFVPRIVLMPPGELHVTSSDPVPHNVHTFAQFNRSYNESMNPLRSSLTFKLPRPERINVRCDLHGWMKGYVVVAENPYYVVTGPGGQFKLEGVPAGRYRLQAWHEILGELEQDVTVEVGKTTTATFNFESR